jgi:hypothetical protein
MNTNFELGYYKACEKMVANFVQDLFDLKTKIQLTV